MKIELELSNKAVRMMRAVRALTGLSVDEISIIVSKLAEQGLRKIIAEEIDLPGNGLGVPHLTKAPERSNHIPMEDTTGISDGLGDDDIPEEPDLEDEEEEAKPEGDEDEVPEPEEPEPTPEPESMVPEKGGLSDEDLEADMKVENPQVEAKAEPSFSDDMAAATPAEEAFSAGLDLPMPTNNWDTKRRRRRGNPKKRKAKVTPLLEAPADA